MKQHKKQVNLMCKSIAALLLCAGIGLSIVRSEWIWALCIAAMLFLLLPKIFYRH